MRNRLAITTLVCAASLFGQIASPPVLTQPEVERLEATVAKSPGDLASQKLLAQNYAFFILGITSLDQFGQASGYDPAKAEGDFAKHARAILQETKLPVLAGEGGQALRMGGMTLRSFRIRQLHEPHSLGEPEEAFAEALIERAVTLEPDNQTWRHYNQSVLNSRAVRSNALHLNTGNSSPGAFGSAKGSFDAMQANVAAMTGDPRLFALSDLVKQAVRESKFDEAKAIAKEMLGAAEKAPDNQLSGRATFNANLALGSVALREGDKKAAGQYLIAAGEAKGTPSLGSFGPNMTLARDLLNAGEKDTVLEFFRLMAISWPRETVQFGKWADQVRAGEQPNFGVYLLY